MRPAYRGTVLELKPLPVTRLANTLPGALLLALGLWAAWADGGSWVFGGTVALIGAVLAVRGYRLGVTVTEREIKIRGFLRQRIIPRESVAGFTDWPAVVWHSDLPGAQHSRIAAFRTGALAPRSIRDHNAKCLTRLRSTMPPGPDNTAP